MLLTTFLLIISSKRSTYFKCLVFLLPSFLPFKFILLCMFLWWSEDKFKELILLLPSRS